MSPEDKALLEAVQPFLKDRAALIVATQATVRAILADALAGINELLTQQPSDFAQWRLSRLKADIEDTLARASAVAANTVQTSIAQAWQLGEDVVDKPLLAIGLPLELQLPALDATLLASLKGFGAERLKDVGQEAAARIGRELGLVTLGAQPPFDAIKRIAKVLQTDSLQRATTIVRTSVSQAFAIAQQGRMEQSAKLLADSPVYQGAQLLKQWRRSGKIRSRFNHDLIDGQAVPALEKFKLQTEDGILYMMHPHDPKAPAAEVINCGCVVLPKISGWHMSTPGRKPFTELEQRQNGGKAQIEQALARRQFNQPARPSIYDSTAPRTAPDTSTPLKRSLIAFEDGIRGDALETGAFFDAAGQELVRRSGQPDKVSFDRVSERLMRGMSFSHNHPNGGHFSLADVSVASELALRELRAVTRDFRFSLRPGADGWPSPKQWADAIAGQRASVLDQVDAALNRGDIDGRAAQAHAEHLLIAAVAKAFGLRYSRDRS